MQKGQLMKVTWLSSPSHLRQAAHLRSIELSSGGQCISRYLARRSSSFLICLGSPRLAFMQSMHLTGQGPCSSHCRLEKDSLVRAVWQAVHCLLPSSILLFWPRQKPRRTSVRSSPNWPEELPSVCVFAFAFAFLLGFRFYFALSCSWSARRQASRYLLVLCFGAQRHCTTFQERQKSWIAVGESRTPRARADWLMAPLEARPISGTPTSWGRVWNEKQDEQDTRTPTIDNGVCYEPASRP